MSWVELVDAETFDALLQAILARKKPEEPLEEEMEGNLLGTKPLKGEADPRMR